MKKCALCKKLLIHQDLTLECLEEKNKNIFNIENDKDCKVNTCLFYQPSV